VEVGKFIPRTRKIESAAEVKCIRKDQCCARASLVIIVGWQK
jgi:hypothetical protein